MENEFRKSYDKLKKDIIETIITFMISIPDGKIQLDDHRGSLCYNVIDDQESEVIQSLDIICNFEDKTKPPIVGAWIGVYDEDYMAAISQFEVPFLLNILDALEIALEEQKII
jgi:hypothetical protein